MPPKAQCRPQTLEDKAASFTWTNQAIGILIDQLVDATRRGERVDNGGFKAVVSTRIADEFKAQGLPIPSMSQLKSKKAIVSCPIILEV